MIIRNNSSFYRIDPLKSPIKANPLRNPGESLNHRLQNIFLDGIVPYFIAALCFVLIAAWEWIRWYTQTSPNPVLFTVMAIPCIATLLWKIYKGRKEVKRIKLGLAGELAVGQFLERLRAQGSHIFHDIPGKGFNLDHVVIHSSGIYVIETKTLSKPDRGESKLVYDGNHILKNSTALDRNPITQVRANSRWLRELLENSTGKSFPIQPVILFPGWYIQLAENAQNSEVWVLNPKALPSFIVNNPACLRDDEVNMCSLHLSRYIRSSGK